jgi:hypothetical protein
MICHRSWTDGKRRTRQKGIKTLFCREEALSFGEGVMGGVEDRE